MANKLQEYLFYASATKSEFRKVYSRLQYENQKSWKLTSVLLSFIFLIVLICAFIFERDNLTHLIIYSVSSPLLIVAAIMIFFVVKPNKPKLLSWTVYLAGFVAIFSTIASALVKTDYLFLFMTILGFVGFLYLDRPIKNILLLTVSVIAYVVAFAIRYSINCYTDVTLPNFIVSILSVVIVWLFAVIISSYVNFRRIQNHLAMVRFERLGNTDSLTGVFNKNKYDDVVMKLDKTLAVKDIDFAVVVFDVNRLKETNDTYGHNRGDELLIRSVELIKEVFQKSDIYRIGGDEFCCILTGEDYEHRAYLITNFHNKVETIHELATSLQRDTSVASGLATFDPGADADYMTVFTRADKNMYRNKLKLKSDDKFGKIEEQNKNISEEL